MGSLVVLLYRSHSNVFTNESANSIVVSTGIPSSRDLRLIWYSSSSIPTYFSSVDVLGILMIKSILRSYNRSEMFGFLSGSEILCTIFTWPIFSSKNSAVCSVASMVNPRCLSLAMAGSNFSLFCAPPTVTRAETLVRKVVPHRCQAF